MECETLRVELDCEEAFRIAKQEVYGRQKVEGIAIALYGSPGRREIIGGASDADVFFICKKWDQDLLKLREKFVQVMEAKLNYSKIDLPNWGSLEECELFLSTALVEGNQLIESRFLEGDERTWERFELLVSRYNTVARAITNIVFNRYYFLQDFESKALSDGLNLKYSRGGTREHLMFSWYLNLLKLIGQELSDTEETSTPLQGLKCLLDNEVISEQEYRQSLEGKDFLGLLRREILILKSKNGQNPKSILDENMLESLSIRGIGGPEQILEKSKMATSSLALVLDKLYDSIFELDIDFPEELISTIKTIESLYGSFKLKDKESFDQIFDQEKDTKHWAILGMMVINPQCDSVQLDYLVRGNLTRGGYEYVLRMATKNGNIAKSTLEYLVGLDHVDKRYTDLALNLLAS